MTLKATRSQIDIEAKGVPLRYSPRLSHRHVVNEILWRILAVSQMQWPQRAPLALQTPRTWFSAPTTSPGSKTPLDYATSLRHALSAIANPVHYLVPHAFAKHGHTCGRRHTTATSRTTEWRLLDGRRDGPASAIFLKSRNSRSTVS